MYRYTASHDVRILHSQVFIGRSQTQDVLKSICCLLRSDQGKLWSKKCEEFPLDPNPLGKMMDLLYDWPTTVASNNLLPPLPDWEDRKKIKKDWSLIFLEENIDHLAQCLKKLANGNGYVLAPHKRCSFEARVLAFKLACQRYPSNSAQDVWVSLFAMPEDLGKNESALASRISGIQAERMTKLWGLNLLVDERPVEPMDVDEIEATDAVVWLQEQRVTLDKRDKGMLYRVFRYHRPTFHISKDALQAQIVKHLDFEAGWSSEIAEAYCASL